MYYSGLGFVVLVAKPVPTMGLFVQELRHQLTVTPRPNSIGTTMRSYACLGAFG